VPVAGVRATAARGYFGGGTKPGAPTITLSTPGVSSLSIGFDAPAFNGGLIITRYEYAVSTNGTTWSEWASASSSTSPPTTPVGISGLTNGQAYYVKLRAVNGLGAGSESNTWNTTTTPRTTPGAPTLTSVSRGYRKLTAAFSAPSSNGGSAITDYEYSKDNGATWTSMGQSGTTNYEITGLSDFTQYGVRIRAVNVVGPGDHSNTISAYTAGLPNEPTSPSAASNGVFQSSTSWTAPSDNNASAITDYIIQFSTTSNFQTGTVTTFSDGVSASTSATVTGLAASTGYYFRVAAVNQVGQGGWSSTFSATTAGVPGQVSTPTSSAGDKYFKVDWSAPSSNGGSPITGYKVRISTNSDMSGSSWEDAGLVLTKNWGSRTNGTTYYGQVLAYNAVGDGPASAVSAGKIPTFAAPSVSLSVVSGYPTDGNSATYGKRPVNITFSPTACLDYDRTEIYFTTDSDFISGQSFGPFTSSSANQVRRVDTYETIFGSAYITPGMYVTATVTTYNSDGHAVSSSAVLTTSGYVTSGYRYTNYSYTTDTKKVTGGTMARTYFDWQTGNNDSIYSSTVYAYISLSTSYTVSSSRNPSVGISAYNSTTGAGHDSATLMSLNSNTSWQTGGTTRNRAWNFTDGSYDKAGFYRFSVVGGGTITGTWAANEQIDVYLIINYTYRYTEQI